MTPNALDLYRRPPQTRRRPLRLAPAILALAAYPALGQEPLKEDFSIDPTPYFENTAIVVPPSSPCGRGAVVLSTGQPRDTARLLSRPLLDAQGNIDTASPTKASPYPTTSTRATATDNQIARLRDGSLLAVKDSYLWDDFGARGPAWKGETVSGSGDHKGQRAGDLFFRSTDCGQSWSAYATLDFGTFAGGKYGIPRPQDDNGKTDVDPSKQGKRPDGTLRWWVGGPDRTELYVCPYTGLVFLTTRIVSGPYKPSGDGQRNAILLLLSRDDGKSWELLRDDLPAWSPLVMTTTPSRRLFLFQLVGGTPTLYTSLEPLAPATTPKLSAGFPILDTEGGKPVPNATPPSGALDILYQSYHPSISRASADATSSKVRLSYHSLNADGMQETRVVLADFTDPNKAPAVAPVRVVRSEDPTKTSVLYFNFVDPDPRLLPARTPTDTSFAYWIEVPKVGATGNRRYAIRSLLFTGDYATTCPQHLAVHNGKPDPWGPRQDVGDYMSGGFFWQDQTLNFLAAWVDPAGLRANVVKVPYAKPAGGSPSGRVTAVWEPAADAPEIQVFDWRVADLRKRYDELWPQGWRLSALKSRAAGGEILYSAAWRRSTADEIQVYGWSYADFRKKYDELWPQGWRLQILEGTVLGGNVLYTAVWRRSTSPEIQVYGWSYADFRKKYDELWPQGWRLHILDNFVLDGKVLYTAVWRPGTGGEIQVYGWSYADFRKKYDELWPQGWRLSTLNQVALGGKTLYFAVWRPSTAGEIQVYEWSYRDFRRRYDELWCEGWRLKTFEVL